MRLEDSSYDDIVQAIRKYYKADKMFLETYFEDYNEYYVYFRIDYVKSEKCYKLRWFDLDYITSNKISKYECCEYIEDDIVEHIKELATRLAVPSNKLPVGKDNNVTFNLNTKCVNKEKFNIKFYKYVPNNMYCLREIFEVLFMSLPKKLDTFLDEILGNNVDDFVYEKQFRFNLFKGDMCSLFDSQVTNRGETYYQEKKVVFLEKIDDRYFAVVNGNELYVVIVKYDELSHDMRVYCSCPCDFFCKHIYAVIKAIREEKFKQFYKVMIKSEYDDMYDKLMDFNYLLCIGVVDDVIGIVNDDGEVEWRPILDENGKSRWVVVEDDEKNRLVKSIMNLLEKNNK